MLGVSDLDMYALLDKTERMKFRASLRSYRNTYMGLVH